MNLKKFIKEKFLSNLYVRLHGKNNLVVADLSKKIFVKIYGNNNTVILEDTVHPFVCNIYIGTYDCRVNNCIVKIGSGSSSKGLNIHLMEDSSSVYIGKNAMFSFNVDIWASDTHSIIDKDKNELINLGLSVNVEDNVWVGQDVRICKNTNIAAGCVVGMGSIVTKKFDKNNCVIAGNPAKVVKENIKWDRLRPKQYLESYQ